MNDTQLPLDVIARYSPTHDSLEEEWSVARRQDVLMDILGSGTQDGHPEVQNIPLQFVPAGSTPRGRGRAGRYALAGSVAVLVALASVIVALVASDGSTGRQPAAGTGSTFVPPAGLSGIAIADGQISYRIDQQIDLDSSGSPDPNGQDAMVNRDWVSANGDIRSIRSGSQTGCLLFAHSGMAGFDNPNLAFFASLPTDVDDLNSFMRSHVEGSSSHDEAAFVAVGDALRMADGLASPRLRAAMVGVLSRTPGITIHENVSDYLGRPSLRADFVNQQIRPGEIESLYFDPTTFQLTESRDASNGEPSTYNGPSPAYNSPAPSGANDPANLSGSGFVDVMQGESVLDALPSLPSGCTSQ